MSVDWNVDGEHTTYLKDQSTKTRFATCVDCGIALKGPVREGRRCKEHKLKNDADVHREARTNHRKVVPAKTTRMWTCRICNTSREVPLGGAHPVCPDCKDTLTTKRRTHLCEYRHCGREFYDDSMQGNAVYCHVEHRRREKLFRSGLATDLSYFKKADPVLTSE